jgi:TrmH family RNA methyltransferase
MSLISSRLHPAVRACRDAARGGRNAPMLLDGWHLVGEALRAGVALRQVAVTGTWSGPEGRLLEEVGARGIPVLTVSARVLEAMSPVRSPGGIIALADRPRTDVRDVLRPASPLVLVGVDLQDPGNVGAAVRVAEAAGASGAVFCGVSADPWGWKALRAAMGSSLRLPVVAASDPAGLLDALHKEGLRLVATVPRDGTGFTALDYREASALVLGGEGAGLPESIIGRCDVRVSIPMQPPVESLNVAVAAGLLLYEARRQRPPVIA